MEQTLIESQSNEIEIEELCQRSVSLVKGIRKSVYKSIDKAEVITNYIIGSWIVDAQQQGQKRAQYGARVIQSLSQALTKEFGRGYSPETLKNIRKFYLAYCDQKGKPVVTLLDGSKGKPVVTQLSEIDFQLSWTHYLILMRIKDVQERSFYEMEAINCGWGKRELQRQYNSSLYERLLLSKDKESVLSLSKKGQIVEKPEDIIKDPYVLEFLGIEEKASYSETDLETRIINHIQEFMMEMGKGFTYVGRQVRFTFEEDHFRVDLVLYNRLLRCFVLIDLKTGKLKHQDLGQMQMYVNYYDRFEKQDYENPTIGILLCAEKNDSMVELTLPKDSNIYAAQYALYLPDKNLLQAKLQEWLEEETGGENQ